MKTPTRILGLIIFEHLVIFSFIPCGTKLIFAFCHNLHAQVDLRHLNLNNLHLDLNLIKNPECSNLNWTPFFTAFTPCPP